MRAVAIDPGGTTGLCFATFQDGKLALSVEQEQLSLTGMWSLLNNFCEMPVDAHVIYEDFMYRNASRYGLDLTPVKLIGVIEMFAEWYEGKVSFWKQSPATGKSFYTNDKLKDIGVYARGKEHGRDATRHMLQWITFGAGAQWIDLNEVSAVLL